MKLLSWLPQRYVFAIMAFFASIIGYMIRISVELTITHMVNETISLPPAKYDPDSCPQNIFVHHSSNIHYINGTKGSLDWDVPTQGKVVSGYGTSYVITQFLGGMAADMKGGKKMLGLCILISGISTILLPLTAVMLGPTAVFVLRFITGLTGGPIIPTQLSMMSKWVPAEERTFVASIIFPGILLGQLAASYLVDPLVLLAGWQSVYYVFGVMAVIWAFVWKFTCYSNPNEHPYISDCEKAYLNKTTISLIRMKKYDLDPLPWSAFLPSASFWACVIGYAGHEWAFTTLTKQVPQVMRDVLRLDIIGTHLEYQPFFCKWVFSLIFSFTSYILVARGCCSLKFIRQLSTSFGAIVSSLCIIIIMYSGCNVVLATFFMFVGIISLGAYYSGVLINMLDMNPNYAGAMIGVADNVAIQSVIPILGLRSLIVPDALLSQWRIYLWIVVCFIIFSLGVFLYNITTEQIWWDDVRQYGYPENWKRGRFPAEAEIDENGQTVLKPTKDAESLEEKL